MKDAKGHGSEARGAYGAPVVPGYTSKGAQLLQAVMARSKNPLIVGIPAGVGPRQAALARLEASGKIPAGTLKTVAGLLGAGSHSQGVQQVGQPAPAPKFNMNSYTHEIVSPTGEVAARMNLGKNRGFGVDEGKGGGISRSGGPSIHDAVSMPDYMASLKGRDSFPAEHISGALRFLTGNEFAGHTVRRVNKG